MAFIIRRIIVRVRHDADEYVGYTKSIHRMAERRRTSQGRTPRAVPLVGGLGGGEIYEVGVERIFRLLRLVCHIMNGCPTSQ